MSCLAPISSGFLLPSRRFGGSCRGFSVLGNTAILIDPAAHPFPEVQHP